MASPQSAFTASVRGPLVSEEHLLERMLQDFGVVSPPEAHARRQAGVTAEALSDVLHRFLLALPPLHATATLVIDDAQSAPQAVSDRIRALAALEADGRPLLQVVVADAGICAPPPLDTDIAPSHLADATWGRAPLAAAVVVALTASVLAVGVTAIVYRQLGF